MTGERILVVDGNELLRWSLIQYLGDRFPVSWAENTDEAMELFQKRPFASVVIGCPQAPMSCTQFCAWIKQHRPDARVIALPEMPEELSLCRCKHAQFDAVLPKPVELATLKEAVTTLLLPQRPPALALPRNRPELQRRFAMGPRGPVLG